MNTHISIESETEEGSGEVNGRAHLEQPRQRFLRASNIEPLAQPQRLRKVQPPITLSRTSIGVCTLPVLLLPYRLTLNEQSARVQIHELETYHLHMP